MANDHIGHGFCAFVGSTAWTVEPQGRTWSLFKRRCQGRPLHWQKLLAPEVLRCTDRMAQSHEIPAPQRSITGAGCRL